MTSKLIVRQIHSFKKTITDTKRLNLIKDQEYIVLTENLNLRDTIANSIVKQNIH